VSEGIYPGHVWFEDFNVGDRFTFGAWRMDKQQMLDFATLYDPEPFHVDEQKAIELGWGGLIASGPHIASVWRRLSKDAFPNAETVISPGWDQIRWLNPVFAGDVLTSHSEVAEMRRLGSRPGEGLIKMANDVVRQNGDVVMHNVTNWFVRCRDSNGKG
jgi:acyl dehydratase